LANRLQAAVDTDGSMECELTWSKKATPSGLRICRLRASARRTSGNGCSGALRTHPSPQASDDRNTSGGRGREKNPTLRTASMLAIHPTPAANEFEPTDVARMEARRQEIKEQGINGNGFGLTLGMVASLATHATPTSTDGRRGTHSMPEKAKNRKRGRPKVLNYEAAEAIGTPSTSSTTETAKRGVLNPELSRWLMGYPAAWGCCAAMVTRSSPRLRRSSSGRSSKPKGGEA
jgi:hypothetical protein